MAVGVNNTKINTRVGWYPKGDNNSEDTGWGGIARDMPLIPCADLLHTLGENSVNVVIDLVAGPAWPTLLEILKPQGRYAVSGAIAGPLVELDVRTLYLKDLSFYGCTILQPEVFGNLVSRIEKQQIKPLVAQVYPLKDIHQAQEAFQQKSHVGKLVLQLPGID